MVSFMMFCLGGVMREIVTEIAPDNHLHASWLNSLPRQSQPDLRLGHRLKRLKRSISNHITVLSPVPG
jgi:hypothetical protein